MQIQRSEKYLHETPTWVDINDSDGCTLPFITRMQPVLCVTANGADEVLYQFLRDEYDWEGAWTKVSIATGIDTTVKSCTIFLRASRIAIYIFGKSGATYARRSKDYGHGGEWMEGEFEIHSAPVSVSAEYDPEADVIVGSFVEGTTLKAIYATDEGAPGKWSVE